jgi:hypothetical protein
MMDSIPIWGVLAISILLIIVLIDVGYRFGNRAFKRTDSEMESPVSAMAGAVLGLTAFVLAFTFGIVHDRYDSKKELVRDEANVIWTVYQRTDFLPDAEARAAKDMIRRYTDLRIALPFAAQREQGMGLMDIRKTTAEAIAIQTKLWDGAVINARRDMNSDIGAMYIDALNEMTSLQQLRLAIGVHARVHISIWLTLFSLIVIGMLALGYQAGIAGSKRSKATAILASSFGIMLALIIALDRPGLILVTQQPLVDVRAMMEAGANNAP